jgi:GalNAc-alpha-(1->4)-GalNAc-alpha-(1->3)-diNAcBac-PP-undecaprenol alpha-1,4-N-acetyl-D-galactosaminyltransferase
LSRLTLVISSLLGGGAERVMTTLANRWVSRGTEVTLVTLDDRVPFYPLDPGVSRRPLGLAGISANSVDAVGRNLRRVRALRLAIRGSRPDAVVSFGDVTNVLTLLATRGLGTPVVVSERSDPAFCPIGNAFGILRRWLYPHADAVVVQSEEARRFFSAAIQARTDVIPNPVLPAKAPRTLSAEGDHSSKIVLALGRLSKEKGFDLLIEAFARVASERPEWSLEIWGEGPDRGLLERMAAEKGLAGRIRLPGQTRSPQEQLLRADLFALSSRFEGFPNALCEAMACGLPVLSVDCPSGPRQIIRDGVDGLLVEPADPPALADGMRRLMDDPELRRRLASRAPEVVGRFGLDRVLDLWNAALERAARRGPG